MKILMILSKEFVVDPRVYREAKALVDAGHYVTVLMWDRHSHYESESIVDGVRIIRIRNTSLMNVLPNDFLRNPLWWRKAYNVAMKLYKTSFSFDVVHCHDFDTLQTGIWLKEKLGCILIYDAHEIFGYLVKGNAPNLAVSYTFTKEKKLVKFVDHIITVNTPLENYFKKITNKPITIIMNCNNIMAKEYQKPKNKIFTICYMGILDRVRMFPDLIDTIGKIDNVKFIIAGKKENLMYDEVKTYSEKYPNVEFLGTIPSAEVLKKTLESNVVICMFDPTLQIHQVGLPNKIFEAMAAGRSILVTKDLYYSTEFVEKEHCGLSVSYNTEAVKDAIIKLRDDSVLCEELGKNGLKAALKKYNWEAQKIKLLKIYEGFT